MQQFKGVLASSTDPAQLSLTIESFSKVIIGVVGWYAIAKGLDPAGATNQVQALIDLIAQAIPVAFTLYHSMMTVWGLIRKLMVYFGTKTVPPPTPEAPVYHPGVYIPH